jgi:topoisomerase-4 subunit A
VIKEIEADAKVRRRAPHADPGREESAVAEVKVVDEPVTVVVSQKGWVRALKGHEVDAAALPSRPATRCTAPLPAAASTLLLGLRQQRARLQRGGQPAAGRARRRRADHHADRPGAGTQLRTTWPAPAEPVLLLANTGGFGLLATQLMLSGVARGNKPKDDVLRLSGLAAHAGKRARKGKDVEGFKQVLEMKGL